MAVVALVDDHKLLRKGLANLLIEAGHEVLLEADNGKEFIEKPNLKLFCWILICRKWMAMKQQDG